MEMTYSQAVALLEGYGLKLSTECNGMTVIKACAEIIRNQRSALKTFTEQEKSLENVVSVLKSLRLHAKVMRIKDGDMLWLAVDLLDYEQLSKICEYIKKLTKLDNVLVIGTDRDDKLTHLDSKAQTCLMKKMLANLRPEVRVQVLKELVNA